MSTNRIVPNIEGEDLDEEGTSLPAEDLERIHAQVATRFAAVGTEHPVLRTLMECAVAKAVQAASEGAQEVS